MTEKALLQFNSIRKEKPLYIRMRFDNRTTWNKTAPIRHGAPPLPAVEARIAVREFQADIIETTGRLYVFGD